MMQVTCCILCRSSSSSRQVSEQEFGLEFDVGRLRSDMSAQAYTVQQLHTVLYITRDVSNGYRHNLIQRQVNMLALQISAELNGYADVTLSSHPVPILTSLSVTDLQPQDTEAAPFYYTFKVQCTSCREIHPNWVSVSRFVSCRPAVPASQPSPEG